MPRDKVKRRRYYEVHRGDDFTKDTHIDYTKLEVPPSKPKAVSANCELLLKLDS